MKKCSFCNLFKNIEDFGKNKNVKSGIRSRCKLCTNFKNKKIRGANKEKYAAHSKKFYLNNKKDYISRVNKWVSLNRDKVRINALKWAKLNKKNLNFHKNKRKCALLKRTPSWLTQEDWDRIYAFYKKATELTMTTGIRHEVDRILPPTGQNS
jgi:hypothetical protein